MNGRKKKKKKQPEIPQKGKGSEVSVSREGVNAFSSLEKTRTKLQGRGNAIHLRERDQGQKKLNEASCKGSGFS